MKIETKADVLLWIEKTKAFLEESGYKLNTEADLPVVTGTRDWSLAQRVEFLKLKLPHGGVKRILQGCIEIRPF